MLEFIWVECLLLLLLLLTNTSLWSTHYVPFQPSRTIHTNFSLPFEPSPPPPPGAPHPHPTVPIRTSWFISFRLYCWLNRESFILSVNLFKIQSWTFNFVRLYFSFIHSNYFYIWQSILWDSAQDSNMPPNKQPLKPYTLASSAFFQPCPLINTKNWKFLHVDLSYYSIFILHGPLPYVSCKAIVMKLICTIQLTTSRSF